MEAIKQEDLDYNPAESLHLTHKQEDKLELFQFLGTWPIEDEYGPLLEDKEWLFFYPMKVYTIQPVNSKEIKRHYFLKLNDAIRFYKFFKMNLM